MDYQIWDGEVSLMASFNLRVMSRQLIVQYQFFVYNLFVTVCMMGMRKSQECCENYKKNLKCYISWYNPNRPSYNLTLSNYQIWDAEVFF